MLLETFLKNTFIGNALNRDISKFDCLESNFLLKKFVLLIQTINISI